MTKPDWIKGNSRIAKRLNIAAELKRLKENPLNPLIIKIKGEDDVASFSFSDEISRYLDAYWFYYLSLERFLPELGYVMRWEKSLRYVRGRGAKFTPGQKKLSLKYHTVRPYFEYDFFNTLIHARILMDRIAGVARSFIKGSTLPSFTSFADHKKFFQKLTQPYGEYEEYADYIRTNTDWFEMPLKEVRDHFLVHQSPKHYRYFGYGEEWDMSLNIWVPDKSTDELLRIKDYISVSIPSLARDIEVFLNWFNNYGLKALSKIEEQDRS